MKSSLFLSSPVLAAIAAFSTGIFSSPALAETFYAEGVTATSGWLDVNKAYNPAIFYKNDDGHLVPDLDAVAQYFPHPDSNLCWAASASNILQYMQVQAGRTISYSSTHSVETGNTKVDDLIHSVSQLSVYETFTSSFQDVGYTAYDGIAWYTTGTAAYLYSNSTIPANPGAAGGFYTSTMGSTIQDFQNNVLATHYQVYGTGYAGNYIANEILSNSVSYQTLLSESLANGPIALSVNQKTEAGIWTGGHALTCWGFETDGSGTVTAIFITDSDDGQDALKTLNVSQMEDGVLALSGGNSSSPVYDKDGNQLGAISGNYDGYYLTSMSSFHNFYLSVPEPSGSLLFLTGSFFILWRRRKSRS